MSLKDKQNILAKHGYNAKVVGDKFIIYDSMDDNGYRLEVDYDERENALNEAVNFLLNT